MWLVNIYTPNSPLVKQKFFTSLEKFVQKNGICYDDMIVSGDLNIALNPDLDKDKGDAKERQYQRFHFGNLKSLCLPL